MLRKGKGFADQQLVSQGRKNAGRCFGEEGELDDKTQHEIEGNGMKKGMPYADQRGSKNVCPEQDCRQYTSEQKREFSRMKRVQASPVPRRFLQHVVWEGKLGDVIV